MPRRSSSSPKNPLRMRYSPSSPMQPHGVRRSPLANRKTRFASPSDGREMLKKSRTAFAVPSSIPARPAASAAETAPNSRHSLVMRFMSCANASASMFSIPAPDWTISPTRSRAPKNRSFNRAFDASRTARMSSSVKPRASLTMAATVGSPNRPVFSSSATEWYCRPRTDSSYPRNSPASTPSGSSMLCPCAMARVRAAVTMSAARPIASPMSGCPEFSPVNGCRGSPMSRSARATTSWAAWEFSTRLSLSRTSLKSHGLAARRRKASVSNESRPRRHSARSTRADSIASPRWVTSSSTVDASCASCWKWAAARLRLPIAPAPTTFSRSCSCFTRSV